MQSAALYILFLDQKFHRNSCAITPLADNATSTNKHAFHSKQLYIHER